MVLVRIALVASGAFVASLLAFLVAVDNGGDAVMIACVVGTPALVMAVGRVSGWAYLRATVATSALAFALLYWAASGYSG